MSTEAHTIPDETVSRVARLINAAEDQRQQAAEDLKQIYADLREELRGLGWTGAVVSTEVAALKGAISEMRLDEEKKAKREERGERVDDYLSLLTRARARGARTSDGSPSVSSELTTRSAEGSVVPNSPETATEMHQRPSFNDKPCSKVVPQDNPSPAGTGSELLAGREGRPEGEAASADLPTNSDQLSKGGEGAQQAWHELASKTGEGAVSALPDKPKFVLRPHCLNPGKACGGSGPNHCWSCKKAMAEKSGVAA